MSTDGLGVAMAQCECRTVCYCRDPEPPESPPVTAGSMCALLVTLALAGLVLVAENAPLQK
jgi:hypothetical protein